MPATYISIQEAAELSGKSVQTIRRAVKSKKLSSRKKKTPQGYNYGVNRESVIKFYKLRLSVQEKRKTGIKGKKKKKDSEYASYNELYRVQRDIKDLMDEQKKTKDSFMRFMKTFQERFVLMENQLKLLEEPKDKRWYQFWR